MINRRAVSATALWLLAVAVCVTPWAGTANATPSVSPAAVQTAPAAAGDDEVVVVERNALGTITKMTRYQPAGSAEKLRAQLRARGVTGVLPAGQQAPNQILAACAPFVGTAAAWCDHAWAYNGFNDPQVYFLDHTPAGYPVTAAVADWYQSPGIDAYYRWHTEGLPRRRTPLCSRSCRQQRGQLVRPDQLGAERPTGPSVGGAEQQAAR
jgi:hypothetical protein